MEILKPLAKNDSSLMKMTGSKIMGQAKNLNGRVSAATIDYKMNNDGKMSSSVSMKDPYGSITIQDMTKTTAKAQFEGTVSAYPVPDTQSKLYRIHGQVDMSQNKKPKTTFLSEIITKAKSPAGRRPGPSEYQSEKAFDYATQHNTKRFQWNKEKRESFTDDIIKREKNMKGPADYEDKRKKKILGTYT